jgi:hypothetical protein
MTLVMALDFSKKTGVALGRRGEIPLLWTQTFGDWDKATIDEVARGVLQWMPGALSLYKPDLVVVEAPLTPSASRGLNDARIALGGDFLIKGHCCMAGVRCLEIHNKTWKANVLGNGNLPSRDAKQRSLMIAREFGLSPKNDNESDAFCIWLDTMIKKVGFFTPAMQQILAKAQRKLL